MTRISLQKLSDEELVKLFAELGVQQDDAELHGEISKLNKLMLRMRDVEEELKVRPGDQRRLLSSLYVHNNPWVRIGAIQATLAVKPKEARRQLEKLAETHEYPPSAQARGALKGLDDGSYIPD